MKLHQSFTKNITIENLLVTIEAQNKALNLIPTHKEQIQYIQRKSQLKSAVYSARIEGNPLTLKNYAYTKNTLHKIEIQNIADTLKWLSLQPKNLSFTTSFIKKIHSKLLHNLHASAGSFRTEQSAVFDSSGVAIYLTPPPQDIKPLLTTWSKLLKETNLPIPIKTAISHYQFEKIHPFLDGNGRVGRLLTTQILRQNDCDLKGLLCFEEFIDSTKTTYYQHLEPNVKDITPFVQYFLEALAEQGTKALKSLSSPRSTTENNLLPRRQEILSILRDHNYATFNFIQRRFVGIPASTLRYDLQQLAKKGLIKKLGVTRGVQYTPVK